MAVMTVRNIPDEVHRALKLRAKQNGHSAEAEVRDILAKTVLSEERLGIGTEISAISRKYGLIDEDLRVFEHIRERYYPKLVDFGEE